MLLLRESQRLPRRLLANYMTRLINEFEVRYVSGQSEVKIFDTYVSSFDFTGWVGELFRRR